MFCERNYERVEININDKKFIDDCVKAANEMEENERRIKDKFFAILGVTAVVGFVAATVISIGLRYEPAE